VRFDPDRAFALGGVEVPEDRQRAILESLGFEFAGANDVRVPTWRRDVVGTADLVEEVARITGYDRIVSTPLPRKAGVAKPTATRSQMIERNVRRTAAARGLDEAVTWSFISEEEAAAFGTTDWRLANPISEDMKVMRPSLLPGLIAVANLQLYPNAGPTWHPGRSATLRLGPKTIVAAFGELHPRLEKLVDAPEGSVAAEVYLDAIPAPRSSGHARPHYTPPALQPVTRDFAFIVPSEVQADNLVRAIRGADKQAITAARLFDRFESADGLSLAVEVTLQPGEKSFTEAELAEISKRIVAAAEKLGARLRS